MGQIVGESSTIFRCNLIAIRSGGTKANITLAENEVWLIDTTNSLTNSYSGMCDAYIIGDGSNDAINLPVLLMPERELVKEPETKTFSFTASGTRKDLLLMSGDVLTEFDDGGAGITRIVLYKEDGTSLNVNISSFPYELDDNYTKIQAYKSSSPTVVLTYRTGEYGRIPSLEQAVQALQTYDEVATLGSSKYVSSDAIAKHIVGGVEQTFAFGTAVNPYNRIVIPFNFSRGSKYFLKVTYPENVNYTTYFYAVNGNNSDIKKVTPNFTQSGYTVFSVDFDGGEKLAMVLVETHSESVSFNVEIVELYQQNILSIYRSIFGDSEIQFNSIVEFLESNTIDKGNFEEVLQLYNGESRTPFVFSNKGKMIMPNGSVDTTNNYRMSDKVFIEEGEMVVFTAAVGVGGRPLIIVTDEEESYYRPVVFGATTPQRHTYLAGQDCWVILQYANTSMSVLKAFVIKESIRLHNIENSIEDINTRLDNFSVDNLPDYVNDEIARIYELLKARILNNSIITPFNTDQHFDLEYSGVEHVYNPKWVMNGIKAMAKLGRMIPFDVAVLGGDVAGYGGGSSSSASGILEEIGMLKAPLLDLTSIVFSLPGNHDAYQNSHDMTAQGMYNSHYKNNLWKGLYHSGIDNCDAYIDDPAQKIRYIFVDTWSRNIRSESYKNFLNSSLSSLPSDYNTIIFSHNPLTNEFSGQVLLNDGTEAFANPQNDGDLLDTYADRIIACICGHSHSDVYAYSSSGILFIETMCACPHQRHQFENLPYLATINSRNETSYDIFVINQSDKTLEAIRYGQGSNRKWVYKGENAGFVDYRNYVYGACSEPNVSLTFTSANDVVTVTADADGKYIAYLKLGETYTITATGYSVSTNSITLSGNAELNLTLSA